MGIGENIKTFRLLREMGQKELAEKLFISDKTVSSWECGRTEPKMGMIESIAEALRITKTQLINGEFVVWDDATTPAEIERYERTAQDPPSLPETAPSLSPTALEIARAYDQAAEYQQLAVCQLLGVDYKKGIESSRDVG